MNDSYRTEVTDKKLLDNRLPDERFIDDILFSLAQTKGIAGLLGDAVCLSRNPRPFHEINLENLERTAKAIELGIEEAIILLDDFWAQQIKESADKNHPLK